jgi:hypothetical protein
VKSFAKRQSELQERRTARAVGGRVQPASGALPHAKGDVRAAGELRIECKTTSGSSYILKKSDLKKITREAQEHLEEWAFEIQFQKQSGMGKKFVVQDWTLFHSRWAQQATEEDVLATVTYVPATARQQVLRLNELTAETGQAEQAGKTIVFEIIFSDAAGNPDGHYALVSWELWQGLRESAYA